MSVSKNDSIINQNNLFSTFKEGLLNLDPIWWIENNLMLDGEQFRLTKNGYRPFVDIYRYIGIKALNSDAKPVVLVKGRQVGATTMCAALELYFMSCGMYGNKSKYPIRVMHCFPTLVHCFAYAKTKLNPMITAAKPIIDSKNGKTKSIVEAKLDNNTPANDSLQFKQFAGGNHIWIESTGVDGDRLRNRTVDAMMFDECFPYSQNIETEFGKKTIGSLYKDWCKGKELPRVKTYNEKNDIFEYKKITNAWKRGKRKLIKLICGNREIKCTPNHKFLTNNGWVEAENLKPGSLILTTEPNIGQLSNSLNEDQFQIILGSFLGDGSLSNHGTNQYRLVEIHGIKQKEYCEWKSKILNGNVKFIENNGYSKKPAIKFQTKLFAIDKSLPSNKKNCPQWILDKLDARGLAVWFMDDGSSNKKGAVFNTCSFDEDSQIRMVEKLKSMGINSEYRFYPFKDRRAPGYFSIYLNKENYIKLCKLINPYLHHDLYYKVINHDDDTSSYQWNNKFNNHGLITVKQICSLEKEEAVYDIEVEDNHNFIITSSRKSKNLGGLIAHNCQDIPGVAIGAAVKLLTKAKHGPIGQGMQVYLGTPKAKGSEYYKIWNNSSQQYFHLNCEKCDQYFPLYTPGSDEWEKIWLYGYIVKCTHCGHEQDKRDAAERGKWVAANQDENAKFVGFHINQLYIPEFTKEMIIAAKPENHPTNTERLYKNEVLGEFWSGDGALLNMDDIHSNCADKGRKFRAYINLDEQKRVYAGFDWGKKGDTEQMSEGESAGGGGGQSYSCGVILTLEGPQRFSIDFATRLKQNDLQYKKEVVEQMFRKYSVTVGVGDIGYANDLTEELQRNFGDRFLASQALPKVNGYIKFNEDYFPKTIGFERDYHIAELIDLIKKGNVRFPYGSYDEIYWLIQHCCSMEIKVTMNRINEPIKRYVKGPVPNDGFMALLNAYLAYKFDITQGFKYNGPNILKEQKTNKIPAVIGYIPKMRPMGG